MTVDELRTHLFEAWRDLGGDFLTMDVAVGHVDAALEALHGNDPEAKRGAAVVLALAYTDRFGVAAHESLSPWLSKALAHVKEALGLNYDAEALISKVNAALKGKTDAEDVLVSIAGSGDPGRFVTASLQAAQHVNDAAVNAGNALTSYQDYLPRLEEIEAKAGALDVPRLTPAALKALETVSHLSAADWSKDRRPATVETLRFLVAAFDKTHWCPPSEVPAVEAASLPEKPRRGSVLSRSGA